MAGPAAASASLGRTRQRERSSSSASAATISTFGPPSTSDGSSTRSLSPIGHYTSFYQRRRRNSNAVATARAKYFAFASAILSALCAGSITTFSLYGHIFQSRLRYSQFEVNGVAIAGSVSSYLPVPILGYLCDRLGPAPLSLGAAAIFGAGYSLAAAVFMHVDAGIRFANDGDAHAAHLTGPKAGSPFTYALMIAAFVCIGTGTASMYLSAVATCAKNFGKGKHRGLALAVPIASFGLSGMWQSQIASRVLYERAHDGTRGDVDVVRYFMFLAILLSIVGVIGFFGLRIVDEEELIENAVEELERSGLLDSSVLFTPGGINRVSGGYGTINSVVGERSNPFDDHDRATNSSGDETAVAPESVGLLSPTAKNGDEESADIDDGASDEARRVKEWVLNAETRRFLSDHTMWLFAAGFFFMVGPGEAFINNLGTVIQTLYPPPGTAAHVSQPTSAATHVSLVGITSTIARLATGTLTDLLAPTPDTAHIQLTASQILEPPSSPGSGRWVRRVFQKGRLSVSRVVFLLFFAILLSVGLATLASGTIQNHGERFWIVSSLVGAGYGAVFSLTPIIITVIWGVENFATNWGIVATMPALGATMWGLIYSAVYQAGGAGGGGDIFCYGKQCYASTFWGMSGSVWIACGLVMLAWKGKNGWKQRGIVI
ncbi:hypothetical protein PspLS_06243 [Pyricularia sp. CBS 133598]|nr:hypothetical protein PspLS_06243 [Pyricularia sp. CBS 133598]